jgi:hypothetical protein
MGMARWVLAADVGIETLGGVFSALLPAGQAVPCRLTQIFSTAEDNQSAVTVRLSQRAAAHSQDLRPLGSFDLLDIPPAARGAPRIEVAISIDADGALSVEARNSATDHRAQIRVAATEENRVQLTDTAQIAPQDKAPPALLHGLGVEDSSGAFFPFFEAGAKLPAEARRSFPSTQDAQTELTLSFVERIHQSFTVPHVLRTLTFRMPTNDKPAGAVALDISLRVDDLGVVTVLAHRSDGTATAIPLADRAQVRIGGAWLHKPSATVQTTTTLVFVSHASPEADRANALVQGIESAAAARCWVAPRDVRPGADYRAEIIDAIKASTHCVVLMSAASNASPHVLREVTLADQYSKKIIPVRLDDTPMRPELEYLLSGRHWTPWTMLEKDFTKLL